MELYISCNEERYDLYNNLNRYFEVEILEDKENTMGIGELKVFLEPITKTIETLGNIIVAFGNMKKCTIKVKNGEKEFVFEGQLSQLENEEVANILVKLLEV